MIAIKVLDMNDIHWKDLDESSVRVIQEWGYTETGVFYASYEWRITHKGDYVWSCLSKKDGIERAKLYAEKNGINTIYFSDARKSYYGYKSK